MSDPSARKKPNVKKDTAANRVHATRRTQQERSDEEEIPVSLPADFFGRDGLLVQYLCKMIEKMGQIASGPHGELYWYKDGVWHPGGEREVGNRVRILLQDRFRGSHVSNAQQWFSYQPSRFSQAPNTRYLNLPNGLLDWWSGELLPHDPNVGLLPRIPVEWDPDATCPQIDSWLGTVLPEDCHDLAYEGFGYMLYTGNPLHKALMLYGEGRNGKGTYIRLGRKLTGSENVAEIPPQDLDDNRFAAAGLYGKLANLIGDVDPKTFRMTAKFKQVTGEDVITVERKHGQPFSFAPYAFHVASFNTMPRSADSTEGFFSRWVVMPFNMGYFPTGIADSSIEDKMHSDEELRGLLVKSVEALRGLIGRNAFSSPQAVQEATREFRISADPVREFVEECVAVAPKVWLPRTSLLYAYRDWSHKQGHAELTNKEFYAQLRSGAVRDVLGVELKEAKRRGVEGFRGINVDAASV